MNVNIKNISLNQVKNNFIAKPRLANANKISAAKENPPQQNSSSVVSPMYFHPTFCGNPLVTKFSKLLDAAIATSSEIKLPPDEIKNAIKSCCNIKNFIAGGKDAKVYKIDGMYVIKVNDSGRLNLDGNFKINDTKEFDFLKRWYGAAIAEIGNVEILRNAAPRGIAIPAGVPLEITNMRAIKEHYTQIYLPKCAKLPQEAFNGIAHDFKALNNLRTEDDKFYAFDEFNPNNFLIAGNSIKIVDKLEKLSQQNKNGLPSMLEVFLNKYNKDIFTSFDENLVANRRKIFKKCIIACENAELPHINDVCGVISIKDSFRLVALKQNWDAVHAQLHQFRKTIPKMDERIVAIYKYLAEIQ